MIVYKKGDIFESEAQVLVNPVNTVGVMGKGLALAFKQRYPEMFKKYQVVCSKGLLDIGKLQLVKENKKIILNFPTKKDWREPSKIEYVEEGLYKFLSLYKDKGIKSIAFPKIGAGLGGLNWETEVKPLMEEYCSNLEDIMIEIYE